MKAALPPSYVNTPVSIAYAEVDDALIVTMTRILGLCWAYDYERTPALTPEQVAELTGRPRSTLYRHLKQLRDLKWIRVDPVGRPACGSAGRRIVIRPIVAHSRPSAEETAETREQACNEVLLQALTEIGVEEPKRSQLARREIDPLWVRAWHLWVRHPYRQSLSNPVGNIIRKLESGQPPPVEFLRAAEEQARWRQSVRDQDESEGSESDGDVPVESEPDRVLVEARELWAQCLADLQLQMTRDMFATWLQDSQAVEAGEDRLIIAVRHDRAVDWLQNRLQSLIQRTVARRAGRDLKVDFIAEGWSGEQASPALSTGSDLGI